MHPSEVTTFSFNHKRIFFLFLVFLCADCFLIFMFIFSLVAESNKHVHLKTVAVDSTIPVHQASRNYSMTSEQFCTPTIDKSNTLIQKHHVVWIKEEEKRQFVVTSNISRFLN